MIIYMIILTASSLIFLLIIHSIHLSHLAYFYNHIGQVNDAGSVGIGLIAMAIDFLIDSGKYLIISAIISVISLVIYIWALVKPARWKAYSMMGVGIGLIWLGGYPPQELVQSLSEDRYSIVIWTLIIIGHIYALTSTVQFIISMDNPDYFLDVAQEKHEAYKKAEKCLLIAVEAIGIEVNTNSEFRYFYEGLPNDDKKLFVGICQNLALSCKVSDASSVIQNIVNAVCSNWNGMRRQFQLV